MRRRSSSATFTPVIEAGERQRHGQPGGTAAHDYDVILKLVLPCSPHASGANAVWLLFRPCAAQAQQRRTPQQLMPNLCATAPRLCAFVAISPAWTVTPRDSDATRPDSQIS